jgi:hypothetical protein
MISLQIHDCWEQLDGTTRQWVIDNSGCVILPRTIVATILLATDGQNDESQLGEAPLSPEDRAFIQSQATGPTFADAGFRLDSSLDSACDPTQRSPDRNEARLRNRAAGQTAGRGCVAYCIRGSHRANTVMPGTG